MGITHKDLEQVNDRVAAGLRSTLATFNEAAGSDVRFLLILIDDDKTTLAGNEPDREKAAWVLAEASARLAGGKAQ